MSYLEHLRDRCTDMLAEMRADVRKLYTRSEMREVLEPEEYAAMVHWFRPLLRQRYLIIIERGYHEWSGLPDAVDRYADDLAFAKWQTRGFRRNIPKNEQRIDEQLHGDGSRQRLDAGALAQRVESQRRQMVGYTARTTKAWERLLDRDKDFFGPLPPLIRDACDFPDLLALPNGKPDAELAVFGNRLWQRACINALDAKLQSINEQLGL